MIRYGGLGSIWDVKFNPAKVTENPYLNPASYINKGITDFWNRTFYSDVSEPPTPTFHAPQAATEAITNPTGDLSTLTGDAIAENYGYYKQNIRDFFTLQGKTLEETNTDWNNILLVALLGMGVVAVVKM